MNLRSFAADPLARVSLAFVLFMVETASPQVLPPGFGRQLGPPPQQQPQAQTPQQPGNATNTNAAPAPQTPAPGQFAGPRPGTGGLNLANASLREVIDLLAQQLKISYVLDPRVQGSVTVNTYGETK